MDIERVNEHTIKFFISYRDIEDRGFDREEIWFNRERGEELFWDMMDEVHHIESFPIEGPLWIQVQALEKGLEIIVTRAQLSKDGKKLELPISKDKRIDIPISPDFQEPESEDPSSFEDEAGDEELSFIMRFDDFEDLIDLSRRTVESTVDTAIYLYDDHYYLYALFDENATEYEWENDLSKMLEFGEETGITIHVLQEYGKAIIEHDALNVIRRHFL